MPDIPEESQILISIWKKFLDRDCTIKELLETTKPYDAFDPQIYIPLRNFRLGAKEKEVVLVDPSVMDQPKPTHEQLAAFDDAWSRFSNGKCDLHELVEMAGQYDWGTQLVVNISSIRNAVNMGLIILYDPAKDAHPIYEGTERQRDRAMKYHPHLHKKGRLLADIKRRILITAINNAHKLILGGYDMNAFVFEDPRRKAQYEFFENYINENFSHRWGEYKPEFMINILQIIFFLLKEDIYYCRLIDMIEKVPKFGMNEAEQDNIKRYYKWRLPKPHETT